MGKGTGLEIQRLQVQVNSTLTTKLVLFLGRPSINSLVVFVHVHVWPAGLPLTRWDFLSLLCLADIFLSFSVNGMTVNFF